MNGLAEPVAVEGHDREGTKRIISLVCHPQQPRHFLQRCWFEFYLWDPRHSDGVDHFASGQPPLHGPMQDSVEVMDGARGKS